MKIHTIKISNLLSFPYVENIAADQGITFPVSSTDVHTHILIGPNGSGKSNFLTIINYMFRVGIADRFSFNDQYLTKNDTLNYDKTISTVLHNIVSLKPHALSPDKPSSIVVGLYLSTLDRENAMFIIQHAKEINEMLGTYSNLSVRFDGSISLDEVKKHDTIHITCDIDTKTGRVSARCTDTDPLSQLFFAYMKHFEAIQHLITIFNTFIVTDPSQKVRHLNNTFAIIGSYRKLGHLDAYCDMRYRYGSDVLQNLEETEDFFSEANLPLGFEMLKKKLAKAYHMACPEGNLRCKDVLISAPEYVAINHLLNQYTGFSLRLKKEENEMTRYKFFLEDEAGHIYSFDDISSGDKAILFLVTAMYGFDLENGLIVVDEPELHLHPQMQKKLLSILETVGDSLSLQCIIATQSPLLINETNIQYVHRFFIENHSTRVVAPLHSYHEQESNLVQILRFTNTAKIFFVNKIIMVEGEIDELFFGYYLSYLSEHFPERSHKITNYEIININGKGSFKRRKKFLDKFGLQSYFIGDRDNIQETGLRVDMSTYKKQTEGIAKTKKYPTVIQLIQATSPEKWKEIVDYIEGLYREDIFLLKQGDIETYMGLLEKGVEETIEFYHHQFSKRIHDPMFAEKRKEIDAIFGQIFS